MIYDAEYTIDQNLNRKVIASDTGPLVAFFGDSFTFGTGLQDSQTLPQLFSDLYGHKLGVMNFAFPGYGPQQFLRAIETNMYDRLLRGRARLFVFETAAFHISRAACTTGFMLPAPHYVLADGKPTYTGACWQSASAPLELLANTALYRTFFEPFIGLPTKWQVDLYVAILARAAELVRQKYGASTVILFVRDENEYIRRENEYLRRSGYTEDDLLRLHTRRRARGSRCVAPRSGLSRQACRNRWRWTSDGLCELVTRGNAEALSRSSSSAHDGCKVATRRTQR